MVAHAVFCIINKSSKSLSLPSEVPHDPTLTYIPVHLPNIPSHSLCHSQAEHLVLPYTSGHFLLLHEPLPQSSLRLGCYIYFLPFSSPWLTQLMPHSSRNGHFLKGSPYFFTPSPHFLLQGSYSFNLFCSKQKFKPTFLVLAFPSFFILISQHVKDICACLACHHLKQNNSKTIFSSLMTTLFVMALFLSVIGIHG